MSLIKHKLAAATAVAAAFSLACHARRRRSSCRGSPARARPGTPTRSTSGPRAPRPSRRLARRRLGYRWRRRARRGADPRRHRGDQRDRQQRQAPRAGYQEPEPYPERRAGYQAPARDDRYRSGGMAEAVDICVAEVEAGRGPVGSVDRASRSGEGWYVAGELDGGTPYACWIDGDGRVTDIEAGDFGATLRGAGGRRVRAYSHRAEAGGRRRAGDDGRYELAQAAGDCARGSSSRSLAPPPFRPRRRNRGGSLLRSRE